MGILSGLFRSRDKPTDRTAGSSYSFFLGGTSSGKYVTERSAMQMTAVYCCVRILSEALFYGGAGFPIGRCGRWGENLRLSGDTAGGEYGGCHDGDGGECSV